MKRYKARPGVLLLEVCGEHLLVATGEARGRCPDITQLNDAGTQYWTILCEEGTLKAALDRAQKETGRPVQALLPGLLRYVAKLRESGYLLEEDI